jgi:hypothetical protein
MNGVHWNKQYDYGSTVIITSLLGMTISEVPEFQRKLRNGRFTEATIYWNKMTLDPVITYWAYHNFRAPRISKEVEEWQRARWNNPLLNQQDESGSTYNLLGIWQFQSSQDFKGSWGMVAGSLELSLYRNNQMSLDPVIT